MKTNPGVVALAAIIYQMCLGTIYAWSVFLHPILDEFPWSTVQVSFTFTIFLVAYALSTILGSKWQVRFGPRIVGALGGLLLGIGYLLASRTTTIGWLYVTYGVLGGMGVGIGYPVPISVCLQLFPERRGFATGLAVAGFGAGALILAPLATFIILNWGWRTAFIFLGLAFILLTLTCSYFFPAQLKQGDVSPSTKIIYTKEFRLLWLIFGLATAAGLSILGHMAAFAQQTGLLAQQAALVVGIAAVFNGTGRIIWGIFSDRWGRVPTLQGIFLLMGLGIVSLNLSTGFLVYISAGIIGFTFGGTLALFPALFADYFGAKANYGYLFSAYGFGGLVGPSTVAWFVDTHGSYHWAFLITAFLCVFSAYIARELTMASF